MANLKVEVTASDSYEHHMANLKSEVTASDSYVHSLLG